MEGNRVPQQPNPRNSQVFLFDQYQNDRFETANRFVRNSLAQLEYQQKKVVELLRGMMEALRKLPINPLYELKVLYWLDKCLQALTSQFLDDHQKLAGVKKQVKEQIQKRVEGLQAFVRIQTKILEYQDDVQQLKKVREMTKRRKAELEEVNNKIQAAAGGLRVICKLRPPKKDKLVAITMRDLFSISIVTEKRDLSKPKYVASPPKQRVVPSLERSTVGKKSFSLPKPQIHNSKPKMQPSNIVQKKPVAYNPPLIYNFDYILGPQTSQKQAFEDIVYLVDHVIQGGNSSIFSYGISGSGKTFSLIGQGETMESEGWGIIPRALEFLFSQLKQKEKQRGRKYQVWLQFKEIYQEVTQLHSPYEYVSTSEKKYQISTPQEGIWLLLQRLKSRKVRQTSNNNTSSCSHFFVSIFYQGLDKESSIFGRLTIIDLAGNQKMGDTQVGKDEKQEKEKRQEEIKFAAETIFINRTLLDLTMMLRQLKKGQQVKCQSHFDKEMRPYLCDERNKVALLLTLSPETDDVQRSQSTLKFAKELC